MPEIEQQDWKNTSTKRSYALLQRMVNAVGGAERARNAHEPHQVLARLEMPIYITANYDDLLAEALRAQSVDPVVEIFPWNPNAVWDSVYVPGREYSPSVQRPLVYHLFGHMSSPESLVLSEDDYFEYLMKVNKADLLPTALLGALATKSLLLVGFRADDWDFRVLLRSLFKSANRGNRTDIRSVAVQFVPEEGLLQPERARAHMERYFQNIAVDTFWGTSDDFVNQLARQLGY